MFLYLLSVVLFHVLFFTVAIKAKRDETLATHHHDLSFVG